MGWKGIQQDEQEIDGGIRLSEGLEKQAERLDADIGNRSHPNKLALPVF